MQLSIVLLGVSAVAAQTTYTPWEVEAAKRQQDDTENSEQEKQVTEPDKREFTGSSRSQLLKRLLAKLGARDEFLEGLSTPLPCHGTMSTRKTSD